MTKYLILFFTIITWLQLTAQQPVNWHPQDDSNWELVFSDEFNKIYDNNSPVDPELWHGRYDWNQGERGPYPMPWSPKAPNVPYVTWDFENVVKPSDTTISIRSQKELTPYSGEIWYWDTCHTCETDIQNGNSNVFGPKSDGTYDVYYGDTANCYYNFSKNVYECWYHPTREYTHTTGTLISKKFFRYGVFEMRFRIPTGGSHMNTGPNFWLWNANDGDFLYSEIDIFEINAFDTNMHGSNMHLTYLEGPIDTFKYSLTDPSFPQFVANHSNKINNDWHTTTCIWDGDKVEIYLDGVLHQEYPKFGNLLGKMYAIIDCWYPAFHYDAAFSINDVPDSYDYEIDYFRVWQPKNKCNEIVNECNYPGDVINGKYNSINVGGLNCDFSIPTQSSHHYLAKDYIVLDKGFKVPDNTTFSARISNGECPVLENHLKAPTPQTRQLEKQKADKIITHKILTQ